MTSTCVNVYRIINWDCTVKINDLICGFSIANFFAIKKNKTIYQNSSTWNLLAEVYVDPVYSLRKKIEEFIMRSFHFALL
jgi:hypothetical protein